MTSTGTAAGNRTMVVGATLAFNVTVSGGTAKSTRWWTDDAAVASVSGSGSQVSVKALREGVTKLWVEVTDSAGKKYTDFCWINGATDVPDTPNAIVLKGAALYRSRHTSATSRGVLTANAPATVMVTSQTWVRVVFADSFVFPADNAQVGRDAWVLKSSVHIPATSISVTPKTLIVEKGKTGSYTAATLQAYANDATVSWTSSSNGIATVSASGNLAGVAEGVVTVTGTAASSHGAKVADTAVASVYTSMTALAGRANTTTSTRSAANASAAVVASLASGAAVFAVGTCGSYYLVEVDGKRGFVPKSSIDISATSASVNRSVLALQPGQRATITATVKPDLATNKAVTWASSDTTVATVSSAGVVTAVADGTAIVTVTTADGGKVATTKVDVIASVVPVTGVSLNKASISLPPGGSETLVATVAPADATNKTVTWRSSNTGVATVSSSGLVTAKAAGSTTITVMTEDGGKTASTTVTVTSTAVRVTGVSLNKTTASIAVGSTVALTATVTPSNATNRSVTWSTSNSKVATVSASGVVTGKAIGTATITVKTADGAKTATATVAVTVPVTSVPLPAKATIRVGASMTLTPTVKPTNATTKAVTWASSNTTVATVTGTGVVTGKAVGTVRVTVTTADGAKTAVAAVTVTAKPTLALTGSMPIPNPLKQGTAIAVKGTVTSNYAIAKVTAKIVTLTGKALHSPSATPKAASHDTAAFDSQLPFRTLPEGTYSYVVVATDIDGTTKTLRSTVFTVTKPAVKVTGVKLNKTSLTLDVGASTTLTATVTPSNATNKKVTWTSTNTGIATVSDGKVTAKKTGTATITVTTIDGGKTATAKTTVKAASSTLAITGVNKVPNPLTQGKAVTVTGKVTSNYELTNVTARITRTNGADAACGNTCKASTNPHGTTFNLNTWDSTLRFSKLPANAYLYSITATDKSGRNVTWDTTFTVTADLGETEAAKVPLGKRMSWLFPKGMPTTSSQMSQYLTTITVPIEGGKTMALTVHKKLASDIVAVFEELRAIGFPVRKSDTGAYTWRLIGGSSKLSHHSYGVAVDVNWQANPAEYGSWACAFSKWPCNKYSLTSAAVAVWKRHGFYWGGNWKSPRRDIMHLTYSNN